MDQAVKIYKNFFLINIPPKFESDNDIFIKHSEYKNSTVNIKWKDPFLKLENFFTGKLPFPRNFKEYYNNTELKNYNSYEEFEEIFLNIEGNIIKVDKFEKYKNDLNELLKCFDRQYDPDLINFKAGKIFYDSAKHRILTRQASNYPNKSIISINSYGIVSSKNSNNVFRKSVVVICI